MKIGLIGNGKMGKEIFWYFFNNSNYLKVACVEGAEEFQALIEKKLRKMNKRGTISDEELEEKLSSFEVSYDFNILSDCELVIEAILENKDLKADIFSKAEKIVSEDCILATNTSSIPLKTVFSKCEDKSRCAGMHFFYPVNLSGFIELNTEEFTSQETEKVIASLIAAGDKRMVRFSGNYNMYLNKVISIVISHSLLWKENNNYSYAEMNDILEKNFMTYSAFAMIDSVGIGLLIASTTFFLDEKYKYLLDISDRIFKEQAAAGCGKDPGCFMEFVTEREKGHEVFGDTEKENDLLLSLSAMLLNDIVGACLNSGTDASSLKKAVEDVLNLSCQFDDLYLRYGYDNILNCLSQYYNETKCLIYKPYSKEEYELIFTKKGESE